MKNNIKGNITPGTIFEQNELVVQYINVLATEIAKITSESVLLLGYHTAILHPYAFRIMRVFVGSLMARAEQSTESAGHHVHFSSRPTSVHT